MIRTRFTALVLGLAFLAAPLARAQEQPAPAPSAEKKAESPDDADPEARGRELKKTVGDSERALLDEVERLKKSVGAGVEKAAEKPRDGAPGATEGGTRAKGWETCGDPSCEKCRSGQFCRRRAEKVAAMCRRALDREGELKARFVQLRIDYRKLTSFVGTESERLAKDAESPPDSERLSPEDREQLRRSYLEMAQHVRSLGPAYEERFQAIEKSEAAALSQLAVLRSKSAILQDALEVLKASEDVDELKKELATLEENLTEMSAAVDKALVAFGDLARAIRVEK